MPRYTFECAGCRAVVEASMTIGEYEAGRRPRCTVCRRGRRGRKMVRLYRAPEVVRETYGRDRFLSHLHSLDGDGSGDPPVFRTRGEERAYRAAHQARYGWGKE